MTSPILPKKCAIYFPNKESVSIDKYFVAVGDIIGFQNIVYGGKHGQRMIMHLANEDLVESFTEEHSHVIINGENFPVKKLVNPGFKLLFNFVNPSIPNSVLLKEISKFARPLSQISYVHTGLRDSRMSHIFSYRRQVFVDTKDDIPNSISVSHDSEVNTVYLTIDNTIRCYSCGVEGHGSKNCPTKSSQPAQDRFLKINGNKTIDQTSAQETPFTPPSYSRNDTNHATNIFAPDYFPDLKKPSTPFIQEEPSTPEKENKGVSPTESMNNPSTTSPQIEEKSQNSLSSTVNVEEQDSSTKLSSKRTMDPPVELEEKKVKLDQEFQEEFIKAVKASIESTKSNIDHNDIIRLFRETKNARNKPEIISRFGFNKDELEEIFHSLSCSKLSTTMKNRTKTLMKSILEIPAPNMEVSEDENSESL